MANRIPQVDYYPTEAEIMRMLSQNSWRMMFARDYSAIKGNISAAVTATEGNTESIESLDARLDTVELQIVGIIGRLDTAESEIDTLQLDVAQVADDLADHVAAQSAHGANGDIVGTNDYAAALVGGTVLLGAAVADASPSAVTPPAPIAAAGAAYSQVYAQSQTDAINALSTAVSTLVTDLNAAIAQLNALLASERAAKQIAP